MAGEVTAHSGSASVFTVPWGQLVTMARQGENREEVLQPGKEQGRLSSMEGAGLVPGRGRGKGCGLLVTTAPPSLGESAVGAVDESHHVWVLALLLPGWLGQVTRQPGASASLPAQWDAHKGFSEDHKGHWVCALRRRSPEWASFTSTFSPREVSGQGGQHCTRRASSEPKGRRKRCFTRQPLRKAIFKVTVVPRLQTDAQTHLWTIVSDHLLPSILKPSARASRPPAQKTSSTANILVCQPNTLIFELPCTPKSFKINSLPNYFSIFISETCLNLPFLFTFRLLRLLTLGFRKYMNP